MRVEILTYLKKYIEDKYPMYYRSGTDVEFMKFVNLIASDKKFETELKTKSVDRSLKEVLDAGEMDYIIDDLVNNYAKDRYFKIWDNIEDLSTRIRNVIFKASKRDKEIEIFPGDLLEKISLEIALSILRNKDIEDLSPYKNGIYDEKYIIDYKYYILEYRSAVLDYVTHMINKKIKSSDFKVSNDTLDLMIIEVTNKILSDCDYSDILNKSCNRQIVNAFNAEKRNQIEKVTNYVSKYLSSKEIYDLMNVSVEEVINDVLKIMFYENGEFSVRKLLNGNLNYIIDHSINRRKIKMPNGNDAIYHIVKMVNEQVTFPIDDAKVEDISLSIYNKLLASNVHIKDIVGSVHDDDIKKMIEKELRVFMSVEQKDKPKSIKPKWLKKLFSKQVISLVLAATLIAGVGKVVVDGIQFVYAKVSQIMSDIKNSKSLKTVDEFDGYNYSYIFTRYTDSFKPTINNVSDFYNKSLEFSNSEYAYLGFYRMYDYIMDDKLAIMDVALESLKWSSKRNAELSGLYEEISKYECYLDFVVARLEAMGCEEIKDPKYHKAIKIYKNAMASVDNENETPMDILIANFSEQALVIEEIMSLYKQYSEKFEVEFGEELITIEVNDKGRTL